MMSVLAAASESGFFNAAIREWEQKPESEKTWENIKVFISDEYCKAQKRGGLTAKQAGFGAANAIQEALSDVTKDQANLAMNVVDALKEMKLTIAELQKKINQPAASPTATPTETGKSYAERRAERRKRFQDAPICKHCNNKHPGVEESKCWELEANAADRKPGWKSKKSNTN